MEGLFHPKDPLDPCLALLYQNQIAHVRKRTRYFSFFSNLSAKFEPERAGADRRCNTRVSVLLHICSILPLASVCHTEGSGGPLGTLFLDGAAHRN